MKLLDNLNINQKKAATHISGPLLIVAGAGTGKTTVITHRIAWLIAQKLAKPEEILALTFTDKAAAEMEERIDLLLPIGYVNLWVSTFHAFCERILKDYALDIGLPNDFRLLSVSEQWMLMRNNLERFELDYYRPRGNPTRFMHALLNHFSRAKDELITPGEYLKYVESLVLDQDITDITGGNSKFPIPNFQTNFESQIENLNNGDAKLDIKRLEEIASAYHVYQQLLLENNALDFGDLINYTLELLRARPPILKQLRAKFKYILVDEFQDTNYAQYELVKLLSAPNNNLTVVGDDDQSVYAFRGASMSNILHFKEDFPSANEIFLNDNYRSGQEILDVAYKFIQLNNPNRLEIKLKEGKTQTISKKLSATRKEKSQVQYLAFDTAQDEANGVVDKIIELRNMTGADWSDFAILTRANSSAAIFVKTLDRYKVPFEYVASRGLYREPLVLEILNYLRLVDQHHDSSALYRVLTSEPFALPHDDLIKLVSYAKQKTLTLYTALKHIAALGLSQPALEIITKFQEQIDQHAAMARVHSAAEVYVKIVRDLGIEDRVAHPALAQEAQYLVSFYKRIQSFELDCQDHCLHSFLAYLDLEIESGEEGRLPADFEKGPDTVKIITAHSAKGLEWRYVFVVHLVDRRFPSTERREPIELPKALIKEILPEGDAHLEEERRLFYVAMTRARDGLYLTRAEDYFGKMTKKPSRFLYELGLISNWVKPSGFKLAETCSANPIIDKAHYLLPESFSFSSVSAFKKCPLEYKFRHLLKLPAPGAAQLSFGNTIHKTLEEFLKLWQSRLRNVQPDLFGKSENDKVILPTFEELKEIYERVWIDDWYEDARQKKEYRNEVGPKQLKNFYKNFSANLPNPKYLETRFKLAMGQHKFIGKIDRIDTTGQGSIIIDYKTGPTNPEKLQKVDRDQLIIYQIAAEEFLNEKIANAAYWYLDQNQFSETFIATDKQKAKVINEYEEIISTIIKTIKEDSFFEAEQSAPQHECKFCGV